MPSNQRQLNAGHGDLLSQPSLDFLLQESPNELPHRVDEELVERRQDPVKDSEACHLDVERKMEYKQGNQEGQEKQQQRNKQ